MDDLATAAAESWGSDASAPMEVMLDGFAGKQMVLTVPTDVDFADCFLGRFQWGVNDDGGERYYQGPGQIGQWWILDVDGAWLLINATYLPEASPQDRAELQAIVDSIQIETE